ncbi:MAG: hypothetical protein GXO86_00725 [Chlorobi bacterium]|nr:hypothetical protein [Chlorobiota bacterium]
MKLLEFLERINREKFPFTLHYVGENDRIEVEIDAFFEKWVVIFAGGEYTEHAVFPDNGIQDTENPKSMDDLFDRPQRSWKKAAEDLGIEFISPFSFTANGIRHQVTGLLPQFGGKKGALITSRKDPEEARSAAEDCGNFFISGLNPYHYDRYNRERFIQTLNDWGWSGEGTPPAWFSGRLF